MNGTNRWSHVYILSFLVLYHFRYKNVFRTRIWMSSGSRSFFYSFSTKQSFSSMNIHIGNRLVPNMRNTDTFPLQLKSSWWHIDGYTITVTSYDRRGVSNHRPLDCVSNSLFRLTTMKTSKGPHQWLWCFHPLCHVSIFSISFCPVSVTNRVSTDWKNCTTNCRVPDE